VAGCGERVETDECPCGWVRRLDKRVKAAIAGISDDAWQAIAYTDALSDEMTQRWGLPG
jgi:hypothetical protein